MALFAFVNPSPQQLERAGQFHSNLTDMDSSQGWLDSS